MVGVAGRTVRRMERTPPPMGMMEFAGETGRKVAHDWTSAPFVKPPEVA